MIRRATISAALTAALAILPLGAMAQDGGAPSAPSPNPLSALSLEELTATRSFPLFTPSRTGPVAEEPIELEPVAIEPEVPVEAAPTPPDVRLIGIVVTRSEQVAILADRSTGEVHRIRSGEDHDGWEVRFIDARSVELHNGEQVHPLTMFAPGSEQPPSPPPEAIAGEALPPETPGEIDDGIPRAEGDPLPGGDPVYTAPVDPPPMEFPQ